VVEQRVADDQRRGPGFDQPPDERVTVRLVGAPHHAGHQRLAGRQVAARVGQVGGVDPAERAGQIVVVAVQHPDAQAGRRHQVRESHREHSAPAVARV
jgi:hypothetical protein